MVEQVESRERSGGGLTVESGAPLGELVVCGDLDWTSAPALADAIARARAAGADDVVLDVAGVSFVDSAGLRCLLIAAKNGPMTLRNPSTGFLRLITMTGVSHVLRIA